MPEGSEQAPVVVPIHPVENGEFHRLAGTPRAAPVPAFAGMTDEFRLVPPEDGLGQNVVAEPAPAEAGVELLHPFRQLRLALRDVLA